MIKYIYSIFHSPSSSVLQNLLLIAFIALLYHVYKDRYQTELSKVNVEGFTQNEPFVLKRNQEIYDETYAEVYDTIFDRKKTVKWEVDNIIKITKPSKTDSVFLDIGSGTGVVVNEVHRSGYRAYGVECSTDMISFTEEKFPDMIVKRGDVFDPMLFDRSTFTHVTCLNFTIYEFEDKLQFFRNCYFWMMPKSYMILHLVEPSKFNTVLMPDLVKKKKRNSRQEERPTDTLVNFLDFQYQAKYVFDTPNVLFTQTVTDNKTKNIRQNEQILYMNEMEDILILAKRGGFVFRGKMPMENDENQFLCILERTL